MEEILKFATTEQSIRTKAYLFFWKIFVALWLTKYFSNDILSKLDINQLSFSKMLIFTFSTSFLVLLFTYLFFIGIFFLLVKIIFFIVIFFSNNNVSKESFQSNFKHYLTVRYNKVYFNNRESMLQLRFLLELTSKWKNEAYLFFQESLSLFITNCTLLGLFYDELLSERYYPKMFCLVFCLNIAFAFVCIFFLIILVYLNSKNESIWRHFIETVMNGYLEDNVIQ